MVWQESTHRVVARAYPRIAEEIRFDSFIHRKYDVYKSWTKWRSGFFPAVCDPGISRSANTAPGPHYLRTKTISWIYLDFVFNLKASWIGLRFVTGNVIRWTWPDTRKIWYLYINWYCGWCRYWQDITTLNIPSWRYTQPFKTLHFFP